MVIAGAGPPLDMRAGLTLRPCPISRYSLIFIEKHQLWRSPCAGILREQERSAGNWRS